MVDFISPRPDIVFLRRRLRPGETPPARPAQPTTNFLDLSTRGGAEPASKPLPAKPFAAGRIHLTRENPVVRLDNRQSAIGTLRIAGVDAFAFEDADRRVGVLERSGALRGAEIPMFANRRLVDFHDGDAVIGLRHFSQLRRAVYWNSGGAISVTLLDGASVTIDNTNGDQVLYLSVIGAIVEIRLEQVAAGIEIPRAFAFSG